MSATRQFSYPSLLEQAWSSRGKVAAGPNDACSVMEGAVQATGRSALRPRQCGARS